MKVALVHDYIKEYGGAERVLEALHEIWPQADLFTSLYLPGFLGPHLPRFSGFQIKTSFFQQIPYNFKIISPLRLFSKQIFGNFDLSSYDVVVVSATGAYIPNFVKKSRKAIHVCYCHTPPRYLYGYPTARNWKNNPVGRAIGEFVNHFLRLADFNASQKPDFYIANSEETRKRIEKFYRRPALVIYPPVELKNSMNRKNKVFKVKSKKGEYYLAGGRLARAKHIDLIIQAANKLNINLKIFGKAFAGYEKELRETAGESIEFLGEVSDEQLTILYAGSRALIFASEYEDFGIMPVEAQSVGVPVVAYRSGGVKETVIEGKTGVFFDKLTVESIISAIKKLDKLNIKKEDCRENAEKFSPVRFKKEMLEFINRHRREGN